jgi:hypothetical protein
VNVVVNLWVPDPENLLSATELLHRVSWSVDRDWIRLAQKWEGWKAVVNSVMNLEVP